MNGPAAQAGLNVWLVDLVQAAPALFAIEAEAHLLAPGDLNRLQAIQDPQLRRQRRGAAIAQRIVLEAMFGATVRAVELPRDSLGRPHLPPAYIGGCSLSHTDSHALIAVSRRGAVGVDLEGPRAIGMPQARRRIIERAAAALSPTPFPMACDARFLQAWVRLEALAKADGRGIGHILTRIGAVGQPRGLANDALIGAAALLATAHGFIVHDLDLGGGLHGAIAGPTPTPPAVWELPTTLDGLKTALQRDAPIPS